LLPENYVKENAEKEKKKSGWINPDSIGIQMRHPEKREKKIHPVKRPKIPDFCTSHHHNLDLIETFLFS